MTTVIVEQPLALPGSTNDMLDWSFVKPIEEEKKRKHCISVKKGQNSHV